MVPPTVPSRSEYELQTIRDLKGILKIDAAAVLAPFGAQAPRQGTGVEPKFIAGPPDFGIVCAAQQQMFLSYAAPPHSLNACALGGNTLAPGQGFRLPVKRYG